MSNQELCMPMPSEVFRTRLREVRRLKRWTQADLAAALAREGLEIGEPAITRMESGKRGVLLDEAIVIAAVLGVSPLHMLVPLDDGEAQLGPTLAVKTADARAWLRGQRPLREPDERLFYAQTPASETEWFSIAPGAWRFKTREDFEATRAKWERQIYQTALGVQVPPGADDAEDISVRRPGSYHDQEERSMTSDGPREDE
jgi:transcriptional regulator with XRE-family HTH domain